MTNQEVGAIVFAVTTPLMTAIGYLINQLMKQVDGRSSDQKAFGDALVGAISGVTLFTEHIKEGNEISGKLQIVLEVSNEIIRNHKKTKE